MYDYNIKSLRRDFIGIEAPAIIEQYTWLFSVDRYAHALNVIYFVCSVLGTVPWSVVFGVFVCISLRTVWNFFPGMLGQLGQ